MSKTEPEGTLWCIAQGQFMPQHNVQWVLLWELPVSRYSPTPQCLTILCYVVTPRYVYMSKRWATISKSLEWEVWDSWARAEIKALQLRTMAAQRLTGAATRRVRNAIILSNQIWRVLTKIWASISPTRSNLKQWRNGLKHHIHPKIKRSFFS
jgi:hypothetical protein